MEKYVNYLDDYFFLSFNFYFNILFSGNTFGNLNLEMDKYKHLNFKKN